MRERVGVHGERAPRRGRRRRAGVDAELGERVVLEQRELAGEPHDRGAGLGRPRRLGAHHSTRPSCCSSDFTRCETADGVRRSRRAAASKVPSSTTAASGAGEVERNLHLKSMLMPLKNLELD